MSPTDMKFTADQVKFIHDALEAYQHKLERRSGELRYSLKIRSQVLKWKVVDGEAIDTRVYRLEQYQSKIQTCRELTELITTESCT